MAWPTDNDIDTTFPDNDTGEIGADDMRVFQKTMTAAGRDYNSIVENVPASFPPSAHNHPISDVTDLQTELDGKVNGAYTIEVVSALPGTPDPDTIYFVTG